MATPDEKYLIVMLKERLEAAEARAAELQRHLESLTPGGSEYHNDQHRCYEWIAERLRLPVRQQKRISELQAEVERLTAELELWKPKPMMSDEEAEAIFGKD